MSLRVAGQKPKASTQPVVCRSRVSAARQPAAHNRNSTRYPVVAAGSPLLAPRSAEGAMDPYGALLRERIIILGGEVTDFSADAVISQLLLLDSTDPKKDIKLFINSPGGSVSAGMGIYDAMQLCRADVSTYCFGLAASMGAFLLGAGTKGKRHSMPNARIMIHQPLGGASGQAIDVEIQAREMMYQKSNINRIMSEYTGRTVEQVEADTDRDRYMSPLESVTYGIIDQVIGGNDAGYKIEGSTTVFPKTKSDYTSYSKNDNPDRFRGSRFRKATEPYVEPLAPEEKL